MQYEAEIQEKMQKMKAEAQNKEERIRKALVNGVVRFL